MKVESAVSFRRDLLVKQLRRFQMWHCCHYKKRQGSVNGNTMAPNWWSLPWELTKQQRRIFPKICSLNPSDIVRFFLQYQNMLPISFLNPQHQHHADFGLFQQMKIYCFFMQTPRFGYLAINWQTQLVTQFQGSVSFFLLFQTFLLT